MAIDSKGLANSLSWKAATPAVLVVASFVSSGAWLLVSLPPIPIAKALNLATVGIWLLAFGVGAVGFSAPDRRVLWGLCGIVFATGLSFLVGGSHLAVVFYDLFADMPLLQWLAFPTIFLLASGMKVNRKRLETALSAVVALGSLLSAVLAYQQVTTNGSGVFGSTAYSITALVPLIPIAVMLAASRRGASRVVWYACAAVTGVCLGVISGATMGTLAVGFALAVSVAIHPAVRTARSLSLRMLRLGALGVAGLMVAGLMFVQFPALSGRWVNSDVVGGQKNVVSRVYLWQGAQNMVAARPILGFGPSGYRVAAVDYLDPKAFQYGADQAGNIDPTVFSPQSPHSLIWEIATRLGLVGLAAFGAMLALWAVVLAGLIRRNDTTSGLRAALASAFLSALFVLLVNPVVFAIGLFAATAAGLAIGPMTPTAVEEFGSARSDLKLLFGVAGVVVVLLAGWLFLGEWKAYTARFEDPAVAVVQYEAALRITPGNPLTLRRLLENRLLLASDAEIGAAQAAVDGAPLFIRQFAPNLSNFAAYSLAQAQRTGRKDLSWEQKMLTTAAAQMPPIPSTVAEQLHLAVLSGDVAAVDKALPDAEQWGRPYPYTASYIEAAQKLKSPVR